MTLETGTDFAGYTIGRLLGTSSLGAVYLAVPPHNAAPDALKLLDRAGTESPSFRARFARDADLARRLRHPNIVSVLDRGVTDDQLWLTMDYVDGPDVSQLIDADLAAERAIAIVTDVAQGLDYAHSRGVLHRDVKPTNILVAADRALISDFGIARSIDEARYADQDETSDALAYTAPEQLEGHAVDHRADVYALGCVLFQLLTGAVPFPRWNPLAVANAHLSEAPPKPTAVDPALPVALDAVLDRALAKQPDDRYDSCSELAAAASAALRREGSETAAAVRSPARHRIPRIVPAVGALAAVALVAAGSVFAIRSLGTDEPASAAPPPVSTTAAGVGITATSERVRGSNDTATYDVVIPQVTGENIAATTAFNAAMRASLQRQIDVPSAMPFELSGTRSAVVHDGDRVISGLLLTDWSSTGAGETSLIATNVVDMDSARVITLDALFPDLDAGLQRLSEQAAILLPKTAAGEDYTAAGIAPTAPNFINWVAQPGGMAIHFDLGQVAATDVGLVEITVPWSELADVIDPGLIGVLQS